MFIGLILVIILVVFFVLGYTKVPTDKALLVTGLSKDPRIVVGKSTFVVPFLQRKDTLNLSVFKIDVKSKEAIPTKEFINVNLDAVVTVKISSDEKLIKVASENFLNKHSDYIRSVVAETLEGNIREIVGTMELKEMVQNRQSFSEKVQENAVVDMNKLGLEVVSFTVQNFTDDNGVINDLGIDNIEQIKKDAAIKKSDAEKETRIVRATNDKIAREAEISTETEIAIKQAELATKKAELDAEVNKKAVQAECASTIEQENQRKEIERKKVQANIVKEEETKNLEAVRVETERTRLVADRNNEADALLYQQQKEAAGKLAIAEAEAKAVKLKAEAEAEAIRLKLEAEAKGLEEKAKAYDKMGNAYFVDLLVDALPNIVREASAPLNNVDSITMYGEGNETKLVKGVTNNIDQILRSIKEITGIDLSEIVSKKVSTIAGDNVCVDAKEEFRVDG